MTEEKFSNKSECNRKTAIVGEEQISKERSLAKKQVKRKAKYSPAKSTDAKVSSNSRNSTKKKEALENYNIRQEKMVSEHPTSAKRKPDPDNPRSTRKKSELKNQNSTKREREPNPPASVKGKPKPNHSKTAKKKPTAKNQKANKKKNTSNTYGQTRRPNQNRSWTDTYYNYNEEIEYNEMGYREIPQKIDLSFSECCLGDEYFFFEGMDGSPKYKDVNEPWDKFAQWLETVRERLRSSENFEDNCEYRVGQEIIKYTEQRNAHHIYLMMRTYWVEFRDTYLLVEDCPEYVLEFVRGIMYGKMTEKQMWGTREDRLPEGTVIIFDKEYMPKEGEDTGKLKYVYCPNYIEEQMQKMRGGKMK